MLYSYSSNSEQHAQRMARSELTCKPHHRNRERDQAKSFIFIPTAYRRQSIECTYATHGQTHNWLCNRGAESQRAATNSLILERTWYITSSSSIKWHIFIVSAFYWRHRCRTQNKNPIFGSSIRMDVCLRHFRVFRSPSFIPESMRHVELWIFISIKLIRQNLFSAMPPSFSLARTFILITQFVLRTETNSLLCCATIKHPSVRNTDL